MTTQHAEAPPAQAGDAPTKRIVRITGREEHDPADPWEVPAANADLAELSTRRFERLPHRPMNPGEVPAGALEALGAVVGEAGLDRLFVLPRVARIAGGPRAGWVLSPTEVLAVGADRLAVWLDDPAGPRIRASLRIDEVVAVLDRTVLLHGRLELIGRDASIVVRYNTVGRSDIRELLRPLRAAAAGVAPPPSPGTGRDPMTLPHKWMALVRSTEIGPPDDAPIVVAAGDLGNSEPLLHNGVVVLTGRELIVATDPTPDVQQAPYGYDLVVVPRARVLGIGGRGATLAIHADAWPGEVELYLAAHPSLVAEAVGLLGPLIAAARA